MTKSPVTATVKDSTFSPVPMVNRQAVQYEYVVVNNNELYFVSDSLAGGRTEPAVLVGSATRGAATKAKLPVKDLSALPCAALGG